MGAKSAKDSDLKMTSFPACPLSRAHHNDNANRVISSSKTFYDFTNRVTPLGA